MPSEQKCSCQGFFKCSFPNVPYALNNPKYDISPEEKLAKAKKLRQGAKRLEAQADKMLSEASLMRGQAGKMLSEAELLEGWATIERKQAGLAAQQKCPPDQPPNPSG